METLVKTQKEYFNTNITKPVAFRVAQLKKFYDTLKAYEGSLSEAIYQDFQKPPFDSFLTEFAGLYVHLNSVIKKVRKLSKPIKVRTNMVNAPGKSYIIPEPLGVCLVISSWNYPVNLALGPVIDAMAAGNTVILKPSELASYTSNSLAEMINKNFDPAYLRVVEGGVQETTDLLNQQFDKIFFTGSVPVGKIVYQAASKNLTPVTLELGGKSPLIVAPDADLKITVKRLVWGKFVNAGQTCVAPDYALVHKSVEKQFLAELKSAIEKAAYSLDNKNYAQIISEKHFDRLIDMVDAKKVFYGFNHNRSRRYIQPTVLHNVSVDDKIMEDEIFGPILPVLTYENIDDAIAFIKSKPKPLSLYLFSESYSLRKKVLSEVSFGGGGINEVIMHFSHEYLPFGGVGHSGMGTYHAEAGFKAFSHYKSIIQKPTWFEFPLKYYPFTPLKLKMIKRVMGVS
jgi:aldehyde dehydrogenase (NAD+)